MANPAPPGVHSLEKVLPTGWGLNMHLVDLPNRGLLVHSPTWLGDDTFARVEKLGKPTVLFAPNHFHHLSLKRFRERYPQAKAVAPLGAIPRLSRQGHLKLEDAKTIEPLLPRGGHVLVSDGLKNGEGFLSLETAGGRAWIVGDAFFDVNRPTKGFAGFVLRATGTVPGLCCGMTFKLLAVADKRRYLAWLEKALADEEPTTLIVSHGDPVTDPKLAERLLSITQARLGVS